jgi:hypothetical protein
MMMVSKNAKKKSKATSASKKSAARPKLKKYKMYEISTYAQSEEFTSAAACAMMVLKYLKTSFKPKKETEFDIWQEAVNGSVWHGSKYGLAYALGKRGLKSEIISSNTKDEGYERKLAVYDGINLDTLKSSFLEIKEKTRKMGIKESYGIVTTNMIKKQLSSGYIPIILVDASALNPYMESSPHWVVIKGYDNETFYLNDPYSDSTLTMETDLFKSVIGFDNEYHMIAVKAKKG